MPRGDAPYARRVPTEPIEPTDPTAPTEPTEIDARVEVLDVLPADDLSAVTAVVSAATETDGLHPLTSCCTCR